MIWRVLHFGVEFAVQFFSGICTINKFIPW
ncbi:PhoP/PhoQ regulator MgrB [Klebsiella pneumoniae]|nr:PhoP/PhoQ regulator MgrB [Klebsiella pneumoniae]